MLRNLAAQKEQQHQQHSQIGSGGPNNSPVERVIATTSSTPPLARTYFPQFRYQSGGVSHDLATHDTPPGFSIQKSSIATNNSTNGSLAAATTNSVWPRTPTAWYPGSLNCNNSSFSFGLQPLSPSDGTTTILSSTGGTCAVDADEHPTSKKGT